VIPERTLGITHEVRTFPHNRKNQFDRRDLLLRRVLALPSASSSGLDCRILSSMPGSEADFFSFVSGATLARKVSTFFVVSVLPAVMQTIDINNIVRSARAHAFMKEAWSYLQILRKCARPDF
jgi:hypothetical protein